MAEKYYNDVDFQSKFHILNVALQNAASDPSSPAVGQVYFNTVTLRPVYYTGSGAFIDLTARANHSGTQTFSTISDGATVVKAFTLDSFAAPVNPVAMNGQRLTGLADPTNAQDAATKNYADTLASQIRAGLIKMMPVKAVATSNQALTGLPIIDTYQTVAGDRVLLTGQTTASQNGPYIVAAGAWTRAVPVNNDGPTNELALGAQWFVDSGNTYIGTNWTLNSPVSGSIVVGTTAVTIAQDSAKSAYTASNGVALTGNNFAGAVAPGGGLVVGATGFGIDTTKVAQFADYAIAGDGSTTVFTFTNAIGKATLVATLQDSSGNIGRTDIQITASQVKVTFGSAPANGTNFTLATAG